jgi:hypothetical protein
MAEGGRVFEEAEELPTAVQHIDSITYIVEQRGKIPQAQH